MVPNLDKRMLEDQLPKELKQVKRELKNAQDRLQGVQQELDFAQKDVRNLEIEEMALETGIQGVGLPISTLIEAIEAVQSEDVKEQTAQLCRVVKILALHIQRLETERRKRVGPSI